MTFYCSLLEDTDFKEYTVGKFFSESKGNMIWGRGGLWVS